MEKAEERWKMHAEWEEKRVTCTKLSETHVFFHI